MQKNNTIGTVAAARGIERAHFPCIRAVRAIRARDECSYRRGWRCTADASARNVTPPRVRSVESHPAEGGGGSGRNRTGVHGFAGRCMTTLPPSPSTNTANLKAGPGFHKEIWSGKRHWNLRLDLCRKPPRNSHNPLVSQPIFHSNRSIDSAQGAHRERSLRSRALSHPLTPIPPARRFNRCITPLELTCRSYAASHWALP